MWIKSEEYRYGCRNNWDRCLGICGIILCSLAALPFLWCGIKGWYMLLVLGQEPGLVLEGWHYMLYACSMILTGGGVIIGGSYTIYYAPIRMCMLYKTLREKK